MTPEEKQAIIDKALELGFKQESYNYYTCKSEMGEFQLYSGSHCFMVDLEACGSCLTVKYLKTPEQLETLFNAIVS